MSCSRDSLPVALLDLKYILCFEYPWKDKDVESPTVGENSAQYTNRSLIIKNMKE